jgi:hypothetical protein
VLSGGFMPMAEWVKGELGLDYAFANDVGLSPLLLLACAKKDLLTMRATARGFLGRRGAYGWIDGSDREC